MARLSDSSGQFDATVFDDAAAVEVEKAAKEGACVLLGVELDRRPGEETPRVTIRSVTSFDGLSRRTRLQLEVEVEDSAGLRALAQLLAGQRGGSSAVRLKVRHGHGEADLVLGRDFLIDAELAARVERIAGVTSVRLSAEPKPQLALVS
jgi:DNA polymerase-3 subunit alpha